MGTEKGARMTRGGGGGGWGWKLACVVLVLNTIFFLSVQDLLVKPYASPRPLPSAFRAGASAGREHFHNSEDEEEEEVDEYYLDRNSRDKFPEKDTLEMDHDGVGLLRAVEWAFERKKWQKYIGLTPHVQVGTMIQRREEDGNDGFRGALILITRMDDVMQSTHPVYQGVIVNQALPPQEAKRARDSPRLSDGGALPDLQDQNTILLGNGGPTVDKVEHRWSSLSSCALPGAREIVKDKVYLDGELSSLPK